MREPLIHDTQYTQKSTLAKQVSKLVWIQRLTVDDLSDSFAPTVLDLINWHKRLNQLRYTSAGLMVSSKQETCANNQSREKAWNSQYPEIGFQYNDYSIMSDSCH